MTALFAGLDLGTGGLRASLIDGRGDPVATASVAIPAGDRRSVSAWRDALSVILANLGGQNVQNLNAIAVDATSGSVVAVQDGHVVSDAVLYNDPCPDPDIIARIAAMAPPAAPVHGPQSALARALWLLGNHPGAQIAHETDVLTAFLTGRWGVSDENSSLKTGYDPVGRCWPDWLGRTVAFLPDVVPAGHDLGSVAPGLGLPATCRVVAGTTDGCASFLATGADRMGDAVTALGTTLTVKILSQAPVFEAEMGVYSHRVGDLWLVGGASNTGGGVLAEHFTSAQLVELSRKIDPSTSTGLEYYPLSKPGERFPINDPALTPRLDPRPEDKTLFLKGMLEGMSRIEALGYAQISRLGGPVPRRLFTTGGGASNPAWTTIRERAIGITVSAPHSCDAATGAALLARRGASGRHAHQGISH